MGTFTDDVTIQMVAEDINKNTAFSSPFLFSMSHYQPGVQNVGNKEEEKITYLINDEWRECEKETRRKV